MRNVVALLLQVIVTIMLLVKPGGLREVLAASILIWQQLLILNRGCKRAPNLNPWERIVAGLCTLFVRRVRIWRSAIILKPSTLLNLHNLLIKRKYRLLFSPRSGRRPGPKGPEKELIGAAVVGKISVQSGMQLYPLVK